MMDSYYKHFNDFWVPIYKKKYFKSKLLKDNITIYLLRENIMVNWRLNDNQKENIWREIIGAKNSNNKNNN